MNLDAPLFIVGSDRSGTTLLRVMLNRHAELAVPPESHFIPRLWASRKIGYLLEEIRLHGEKSELKDEVVRLSKEFGVPTPYTSILVEEPSQRRDRVAMGPGAPPVPSQGSATRTFLGLDAVAGLRSSGGGVCMPSRA